MRASRLLLGTVLAALLAACSAPSSTREETPAAPAASPASASSSEQAAEAAPETASRDRMICKNVAPTGSRIARKSCKTQGEWEDIQRSGQDAAEAVKRRGAQSVQPAG
ncbi:MAG: hypothetical protein ACKO4A_15320 [Gammaproteobacteria bacterium]